ncbi:unnamed protein product [Amoebophrya sp. A25]|nr:unnamed protein product [Amoebophrya sp. A25]|eukprot:GSA25T00021615001.1
MMAAFGDAPTPSAPSNPRVPIPANADEETRQKLWSITTEYEHLLQLQNEHFESVLASKTKAIEQLEGGRRPFDFGDSGVFNVAIEERDRELRLYKCLLEIRDKQLMELQHVLDYGGNNATEMSEFAMEKNAQIQTLMDELQVLREEVLQMKSSSPATIGGGDAGGGPAAEAAREEADKLRKEKEELVRMLVQKERQINAISSVDSVGTDIGALQLGARAISMYTEAMNLRQEIKDRESQIHAQSQELADYELRDQQRAHELELKRAEIAEFSQQISEKTRRMVDLENTLQNAKGEVAEKTREIEGLCDAVEQARKNTLAEQGAKNRIIEELREELASRDKSVLEERAERVRMEALNEELQVKSTETLQQLKDAQTTMDQMMAHTQYQGQLVRDMTTQVQESESKLHELQVQEMYEKRKRALEAKIREQETQQVIQSKEIMLNQMSLELNDTKDRLGNIRRDLDGGNALSGLGRSRGRMNRSQISEFSPKSQLSPKGDETGRQLMDALTLTKTNASATAVPPLTAISAAVSSSGAVTGATPSALQLANAAPLMQSAPGVSWNENSVTSLMSNPEGEPPTYNAYPDDLLDAHLANYLLENPKHVPLFCRLSHGQYLYGTHRVTMRLLDQPNGTRIIQAQSAPGEWILLEELLRDKLEQAQQLYAASGASSV